MKRFWVLKGIKFAVFAAVLVIVGTFVMMGLWNALMPALFGGPVLHFAQALGILVLSRILFGRWGHGRGHHMGWQYGPGGRWQHLTEEERAQFRERFGGHCIARHEVASDPKA